MQIQFDSDPDPDPLSNTARQIPGIVERGVVVVGDGIGIEAEHAGEVGLAGGGREVGVAGEGARRG
jgi:hypothetical protein